jgi:hypothetical protein
VAAKFLALLVLEPGSDGGEAGDEDAAVGTWLKNKQR